MTAEAVQKIADAVLYEGYMLYPYRPSNVKNRQRWTFGGLYPEASAAASGDRSSLQSEVLISAQERPTMEIKIRFLHLLTETNDGRSWQFAVEREVVLPDLGTGTQRLEHFSFPASVEFQREIMRFQEQIDGFAEAICTPVQAGLYKLGLRVTNTTPVSASPQSRDEASMSALVATHAILLVSDGRFISLMDPPEQFRDAASFCVNDGVWPVLAGEPGAADWLLISPIILYDYPQIAPESPGDLFDGTEIDEILTLRILTMTDEEKEEMRRSDPRLGELLDRTESLSAEDLLKLHGTLRNPRALSPTGGHR